MTTAPSTASRRGTSNRRRGHDAERAVARWLRDNGWPHAERAVRTGYRSADRAVADPGDIDGIPGVVISVKDCAAEQLTAWLAELDAMATGARAEHGLLVHKRRGHADPARWWCWLILDDLVRLTSGAECPIGIETKRHPVRMELGHVAALLRAAGWADPVGVAAP